MKTKGNTPSICDTCRDPGHCCRNFMLGSKFRIEDDRAFVQKQLKKWDLPFKPLRRDYFYSSKSSELEPDMCYWYFSCSKLKEKTGRCTIYENRPKVCRNYKPKADLMCCEFRGPWKTIEGGWMKGIAK